MVIDISVKNKNLISAGMSERKFRELLYLFWLDIEAGKVARLWASIGPTSLSGNGLQA